MCGIAGILSHHPDDLSDANIGRMGERLMHRGPDDAGQWRDAEAGIVLGHRRLAVIDLTPAGHQPISSLCGRYVMVFNGEVYNHQHLREQLARNNVERVWRGHCDSETLVECIAAWGLEETLTRAVGMWVLAVWDRKERVLSLARDRVGEKPLYFGWQGRCFVFASEPKAIAVHAQCARRLNRSAIAALLRYKVIPAPLSIYEGVQKLLPGRIASVNLGSREITQTAYWSATLQAKKALDNPFNGSFDDAVDELHQLLSNTIRDQMLADVPLGAFLSGGIDSSTVVALMQSLGDRPVKTFTIGSDVAEFNEATHAAAVAKHLGTDHTELTVTDAQARDEIPALAQTWCEPFADSSQIPTQLVCRLARGDVTVALSGDGGDELFGGYNRHIMTHRLWGQLRHIPFPIRRFVAAILLAVPPHAWSRLGAMFPKAIGLSVLGERLHKAAGVLDAATVMQLHRGLLSHWPDPARIMREGEEPETIFNHAYADTEALEALRRMMVVDFSAYLPDDILAKVDRAAMSVSLETRVPLVDHRIVEFAWRLPPSILFHQNKSKAPLRALLHRHVPQQMIERPKMGFGVPIAHWLRGPLRDWAESTLSVERLTNDGIFDPASIRQAWDSHLSGRRNEAYRLWDVLMVNSWLDQHKVVL